MRPPERRSVEEDIIVLVQDGDLSTLDTKNVDPMVGVRITVDRRSRFVPERRGPVAVDDQPANPEIQIEKQSGIASEEAAHIFDAAVNAASEKPDLDVRCHDRQHALGVASEVRVVEALNSVTCRFPTHVMTAVDRGRPSLFA